MHTHPPLVVVSGAIGSGKGTIVHALVHELNLEWIPTHTTRQMRHDDNILSKRLFETENTFMRRLARGEFVEVVKIADHHYGLLRQDIESAFHHHKPAIIELNIDGGLKVAKEFPHALLLFIQADTASRRERIKHRHMEEAEIAKRMADSAKEEHIAKKEYDFLIENREDHPEAAIDGAKQIILERFPQLAGR